MSHRMKFTDGKVEKLKGTRLKARDKMKCLLLGIRTVKLVDEERVTFPRDIRKVLNDK